MSSTRHTVATRAGAKAAGQAVPQRHTPRAPRNEFLDKRPGRRKVVSPVSAPLAISAEVQKPAAKRAGAGDRNARQSKRRLAAQLWQNYTRTRSLEARNALWVYYQGLVRYLAEQQKAKLPECIDVQDLWSAGNMGLLDAIQKYDPERGVRFETYCVPRIRGAMLDCVRATDWVPRLIRNRFNQFGRLVAELAAELGREPSEQEIAKRLEMSLEELADLRKELDVKSQITFDSNTDNVDPRDLLRLEKLEDPNVPDPTRDLQLDDVRRVALLTLPPIERLVVEEYYFRDRSMKDIGADLRRSESRVCQIHGEALGHLARRLKAYENEPEI